MDTNILITLLLLLILPVIQGLKDVRVRIPSTVKRSDTVTLTCTYELEEDTLYSVKWYRGRKEFYRYTPNEDPEMKVFHVPGVHVVQARSNETHLVLQNTSPATAGKFTCEVSADFPSFQTIHVSGDLEVVEVPGGPPQIHNIRAKYKIGEIVRGNCTSRYSRPAANLTWTINDIPAGPSITRLHRPMKSPKHDMEMSILGLHFVVSSQHFSINGRLKIKCIARVNNVYQQSNEKFIEEEKSKYYVASSSSFNNNPNIGYRYPYEEDDGNDIDIDGKLKQSTNIKGSASSLNTGKSPKYQSSSLYIVLLAVTTSILVFNYHLKFNIIHTTSNTHSS